MLLRGPADVLAPDTADVLLCGPADVLAPDPVDVLSRGPADEEAPDPADVLLRGPSEVLAPDLADLRKFARLAFIVARRAESVYAPDLAHTAPEACELTFNTLAIAKPVQEQTPCAVALFRNVTVCRTIVVRITNVTVA